MCVCVTISIISTTWAIVWKLLHKSQLTVLQNNINLFHMNRKRAQVGFSSVICWFYFLWLCKAWFRVLSWRKYEFHKGRFLYMMKGRQSYLALSCVLVAPILGLGTSAHCHSCLGHYLTGLPQCALHGAALEEHLEASTGCTIWSVLKITCVIAVLCKLHWLPRAN